MTAGRSIEEYLGELRECLQVRGTPSRRFLRECRDHLADAAAERGEKWAVGAFGEAAEIAAAFDAEVATRLALRSTVATVAAVLGVGGSTLTLIHAALPTAGGPAGWAVTFFVAAQLAGVSVALAAV
jgi:hypothetical protein